MGFCSNCGSEMKEGNLFCSNCGAKTADVGQQTPSDTQGMPGYTPEAYPNYNQQGKKPNNNKIIGIAVVGVAALLVIFLLAKLFGGLGTPGYEKPIQYMCEGMEKGKFKTMMKAFPDYIADQFEDFYGDDMDDMMDNMLDSLKDEYGKNVKISYKVVDKEKLDKDDIEELEDGVKYYYGEKIKIKEAYELEVELKVKGSKGSDKDTSDIKVIKIGSSWYFYDRSLMGF